MKSHLGTFQADALRQAPRDDAAPTPVRDAASLLAMLGFCLATTIVLVATLLPEIPA